MEKALERVHYREKIKEFARADEARNNFVLGILRDNDDLQDQVLVLRRDYDMEKQARCLWQNRVLELQDALRSSNIDTQSVQTIAVVLDGDGAIFLDEFYARGREGGAEAAYRVRAFIREKLRSQFPNHSASSWQIMVTLVLSVGGLSKKLLACGIITRPDQLVEFGHGWVSQPLFSFTDVGSGKERADHKVRESLLTNINAQYCKHVFFGPCNDNGYLNQLEELKPNRALATKITLIETRPAEPGFEALNFGMISIPSVFRSDNLPDRSFGLRNGSHGHLETNLKITAATRVVPVVASPSPPTTAPPSITESTNSDPETTSWITVGKNLGKGGGINIGKQKVQPKVYMLLNSRDDRVDEDLDEPDPVAEQRFRLRTQDKKMCNDYHLRGFCPNGEKKCKHTHGTSLPAPELLVLRLKARGLPCASGSRCRDFACTYGHHCRFKKKCEFRECWFRDHHNMDFQPVKKLYEGCKEPVLLS